MTPTLSRLLADVRVYSDASAFVTDPYGRTTSEIKPLHDALVQSAIDRRLATTVIVLDWKLPQEFVRHATVVVERPTWWPAMRGKPKKNLLSAPLTAFQKSWLEVCRAAEGPKSKQAFWACDPALVFEPAPGEFLCRMASVGHEGQVSYFAYAKEDAWRAELESRKLTPSGAGEAGYRALVPQPGLVGGRD